MWNRRQVLVSVGVVAGAQTMVQPASAASGIPGGLTNNFAANYMLDPMSQRQAAEIDLQAILTELGQESPVSERDAALWVFDAFLPPEQIGITFMGDEMVVTPPPPAIAESYLLTADTVDHSDPTGRYVRSRSYFTEIGQGTGVYQVLVARHGRVDRYDMYRKRPSMAGPTLNIHSRISVDVFPRHLVLDLKYTRVP